MVGRAAVNFHSNNHLGTYFFYGPKYVWISWTPGQENDEIAYGPTEFAKKWTALKQTGFEKIDAILPVPGRTDRAYFFSDKKYARIQFTPGDGDKEELLGGVRSISEWASLAKAGFDHVDGAFIVPGTTDQAYIFSDEKVARVSFKESESSPDSLLEGPNLVRDQWANLGFTKIDTILPDPSAPNKAYVFSGKEAARIALAPGGGVDVLKGPAPAAEYWPSLNQAGFY